MIRNEKCEVLDKQNFEPKYQMVYDINISKKQITDRSNFLIVFMSVDVH
jgi:hypothetical protein